jgi:hypothetical protein
MHAELVVTSSDDVDADKCSIYCEHYTNLVAASAVAFSVALALSPRAATAASTAAVLASP